MKLRRITAGLLAACIFAFGGDLTAGAPVKNAVITAGAESRSLSQINDLCAEMFPDGTVYFTWAPKSGADGYEIYGASSKNGSYKKINTVELGTANIARAGGYNAEKEYWFKIRPYKTAGGKNVYGKFSSPVSSVPDTAAWLKDKAPIYSDFLKDMRTYPLSLSYKCTLADGSVEYTDIAIFSPGRSYMLDGPENDQTAYICKDGKKYELYPDDKMGTYITYSKAAAELYETLDGFGNYFHFVIDRGRAKFRSGTKSYKGVKYLYNTITWGNNSVTLYADTKTKKLKYLIMESGTKAEFAVTAFGRKPDEKLLDIPKDYELVDVSMYYGA